MFAGNDGGAHTWAVLASLLQTAKLNGLDPFTWLNDVLTRIVSGDVLNNALDQLLAWNWQPAEHPAMRMTASVGMAVPGRGSAGDRRAGMPVIGVVVRIVRVLSHRSRFQSRLGPYRSAGPPVRGRRRLPGSPHPGIL